MAEEGSRKRRPIRAALDVLASTRTAVVLLAAVAAASVVGTVLEDAAARKYVYGRLWFHMLLGLLGLNLLACMLRRKRDGRPLLGSGRLWSLLTHSGMLFVLVGAMVTAVWAERGAIIIREGHAASAFVPEGGGEPVPLGFDARLLDFRIVRCPPAERENVSATGRVKEYESEVEVFEEGRAVRRHVIRVNSPLVHKGTKLWQAGYDEKTLHWSRLGVSRDKGVWFVYAGMLATTLGLAGRRLRHIAHREHQPQGDGIWQGWARLL